MWKWDKKEANIGEKMTTKNAEYVEEQKKVCFIY